MTEKHIDIDHLIGKNVLISTGRGTEEERYLSGVVESILDAQDDDPPVLLLADRWSGIPLRDDVEVTILQDRM